MSLGIYIQVPFCQTKCTYCNFHTGVVSRDRYEPYANAVCREIAESAAGSLGGRTFMSDNESHVQKGALAPEETSARSGHCLFRWRHSKPARTRRARKNSRSTSRKFSICRNCSRNHARSRPRNHHARKIPSLARRRIQPHQPRRRNRSMTPSYRPPAACIAARTSTTPQESSAPPVSPTSASTSSPASRTKRRHMGAVHHRDALHPPRAHFHLHARN